MPTSSPSSISPFELLSVPPYPAGEVKPALLPGEESLAGLAVGAEIPPVLRLREQPDPVSEDRPGEFAVLVVGERPLRVHAVDDDGGHTRPHLFDEPFSPLLEGRVVVEREERVPLESVNRSPQQGGLPDEPPVEGIYLPLVLRQVGEVRPVVLVRFFIRYCPLREKNNFVKLLRFLTILFYICAMTLTERIVTSVGRYPEGIASAALMDLLRGKDDFPESSFLNILNRLVREGRIRKADGLLYPADAFKPVFRTNPDDVTRKLFGSLKTSLPFTEISIWNTDAILPLMHDVPNFSLTIVGAERISAESVADALENLTDRLVLRDAEKDILSRLAPGRDLVVVTPQVSQAPVAVENGVTCPTLEKILVDILCDNALHALTGSESYAIYAAALDRYAVNRKTLLRYAGRRNRTAEVKNILKETEK